MLESIYIQRGKSNSSGITGGFAIYFAGMNIPMTNKLAKIIYVCI